MRDIFTQQEQAALHPAPEYEQPPGPLPEPPEEPYRRKLIVIPPEARRDEPIDIDEARERIRSKMLNYLQVPFPAHMLLIKAAPGVGKTTIAVQVAEELAAAGKRVMYAGPRHDFFSDIMNISAHPDWWYEWLPRQDEDTETGRPQTCAYAESIKSWMEKGYRGMDFCIRICHFDVINHVCVYHSQKRTQARIIYAQHAHVALHHPLTFNVVIGDENPIGAFMHPWYLDSKWILPRGMDPADPMTEILHELTRLASIGTRVEGLDLLKLLGGAQAVHDACAPFLLPMTALATVPSLRNAEDVSNVDSFHLLDLADLLTRESEAALTGQEYPHRVSVSNGKLVLYLRRPVNNSLPPHIIWLDATANPHLYEQAFHRSVEVVDAQPKMKGRIFQVYDRANNKDSTAGERELQLAQQVVAISSLHKYQRPAYIGYQALIDGQSDEHALKELRKLRALHFYAARGTNELEDCDALFVIGTPQPGGGTIEHTAKMLFFERMTAFRKEWAIAYRPYAYIDPVDGQGRAYPLSGYWGDDDLTAVLWAYREAEIIQAAHRVRPVIRVCDIWLLTNVPILELPPTKLLSIREALEAPEGVNAFQWRDVADWAEIVAADKGMVTADDIAQSFQIKKQTALRYMDALVSEHRWEYVTGIRPAGGKAGRPPRAVRPENLCP